MDAQAAAQAALSIRDVVTVDCGRGPKQVAAASLIDESSVRAIARLLPTSPIVVWFQETYGLAISGHEVFKDVQNQSTWHPSAPEFWHFGDFEIAIKDIGGPLGRSVADPGDTAVGGMFIPAHSTTDNVPCFVWLILPSDINRKWYFRLMRMDSFGHASVAQIVAAYAFSQEKLASKDPIRLPRSERRRMLKENQPLPNIRIVQLRRREDGGHPTERREYHCKWIVTGHWRRLHRPRKLDGAEVTFVHAYIKGPDHAPLLQPRKTVSVVAR